MNTISARTVLLAILAMAGLAATSGNQLSHSESENLATLAIVSGRKPDEIRRILELSKTRPLDQSEAQFLHNIKQDGARFLIAGMNPMY